MDVFYKKTLKEYEGIQVILIYELVTIGNTDDKIRHNKLTQMICAHTHTNTRARALSLSLSLSVELLWTKDRPVAETSP
jgi:hypothetical protein